MGKGRDKQGREKKKKKKAKGPAVAGSDDLQFRHHAVTTNQQPAAAPKTE